MTVATDYKALICCFLFGGRDYGNSIIPYDTATYATHNSFRTVSGISPKSLLDATALTPTVALPGGLQYALAPALAPLMAIWNAGDLAVILNEGSLKQPTTKAQYTTPGYPIPPLLFSHNDQQSWKQSSSPEGAASGIGGRGADFMQSQNTPSEPLTAITTFGSNSFLAGNQVSPYALGTGGPLSLLNGASSLSGNTTAFTQFKAMMTATRANVFANEYAKIQKRSLDTYAQLTNALAVAPTFATVYPSGNGLADQLKVVMREISVSQELGVKRQVFFVGQPGSYDTHDGLTTALPPLQTAEANALLAFRNHAIEIGAWDKVCLAEMTDFGRALRENNGGTDHGWGGHTMVMGGLVNGKTIYGTPPTYADNGPNDVGQGRLIPTTATDQIFAGALKWMGLTEGQLDVALPYSVNFTPRSLPII